MNKKEIELQDTELRLGLPGTEFKTQVNKRSFSDINEESTSNDDKSGKNTAPPPK